MTSGTELAEAAASRMDTKAAAAHLGLAPITLEKMRHVGKGPRYLRIANRVFYRREDLDAYVESRVVETEDSRRRVA